MRKLNARAAIAAALFAILIVSPAFFATAAYAQQAIQTEQQAPQYAPPEFNDLLQGLSGVIDEIFVGKTPEAQKLIYGAAKGLIHSLGDPHSAFLTPEETSLYKASMQGSIPGIGSTLQMKDGITSVVETKPGSPSEQAGMKKGDVLLKVDETELTDLSLVEITMKIRGPIGTKVKIEVYRPEEKKIYTFDIVRAVISLNVDVKMKMAGEFAVITIPEFGDNAADQFQKIVDDLKQQVLAQKLDLKGVVLDLRGNPGGRVDICGKILSNWIFESDTFMIVRTKQGDTPYTAGKYAPGAKALLHGMPTVVLINGASASASEITAGALRDYGLAKIVGEKSYGKGSMQAVSDDLPDGSSFHLTIAWWLTPKMNVIEKTGLTPDVVVPFTEADAKAGRDPQRDKALEMLKNWK
jgi:carboxyl-terminal processing protease